MTYRALIVVATLLLGCTSSASTSGGRASETSPQVGPADGSAVSCVKAADCPNGMACFFPLGCNAVGTCRSRLQGEFVLDHHCDYCLCPVGSTQPSPLDYGWFETSGERLFEAPSWECARCIRDAGLMDALADRADATRTD